MSKKFDTIVESVMQRFQGTNFLVGDRVKFAENRLKVSLERLLGGTWRVSSMPLARFWDSPGAPLAPPWRPRRKRTGRLGPPGRDILQVCLRIVLPSRRHAKVDTWPKQGPHHSD